MRPVDVNMKFVLDSVEEGFGRLLEDAEHQELVRRAVLSTWGVLAEGLG